VGEQMRIDFNAGELKNLTCFLKGKKLFIQKYKDFIFIIELVEMTKLTAFKDKLTDVIEKMSLKVGG
jgi:hypothetical protein